MVFLLVCADVLQLMLLLSGLLRRWTRF